ncbi:hypothetical protein D3C81_2160910 [compost metagenome]
MPDDDDQPAWPGLDAGQGIDQHFGRAGSELGAAGIEQHQTVQLHGIGGQAIAVLACRPMLPPKPAGQGDANRHGEQPQGHSTSACGRV